jgi:DNA-binding NarL/FixJ family response regulator
VLSRQHAELLRLLFQGLPPDTVARHLRTSERTVRRRSKAFCDRPGAGALMAAVVRAAHRGLI